MALSKAEIASRYSKALFAYATDEKVLEQVHEEMLALHQVISENREVIHFLSDPVSKSSEKKDVLKALTAKLSDQTTSFLNLVLEYGRFGDLDAMIMAFDHLYDVSKKIAVGVVTTAVKLDQDQLDRLSAVYAKKHGFNAVRLTNKVDPKILGGVILQVGDLRIDGSVKTRLEKIREQLVENR